MLSNMPKSVFNGLAALTVAIPVVAWSTLPRVHNVQSKSIVYIYERTPTQSVHLAVTEGNATFSWQEGTLHGFGNVQAKTQSDTFEFKLVSIDSSDDRALNGKWDVSRNGSPTCSGCEGSLHIFTWDNSDDHHVKAAINNADGTVQYSFFGVPTHVYEY